MSEHQKLKAELKKPDWFTSRAAQIWNRLTEHRHGALFALAALLVLMGAAWGGYAILEQRQHKGLAALHAVEADYASFLPQLRTPATDAEATAKIASQGEEIAKRLQQVVDQHGGTDAAATAAYFLGELRFQQAKYPEAITAYETHLNKLSSTSPFRALVYVNIGYAYEATGKRQEAAQAFTQAAQVNAAPLRDQAYMGAARNWEKSGDAKQAMLYYDKLADEFPDSPLQPLAKSRAAQLRSAK